MSRRAALRSTTLVAAVIAAGLFLFAAGRGAADDPFVRGDADGDGEASLTDAVFMLGCSFLGAACPGCDDAADLNDDGKLDVTDPVYLLTYLFLGGSAPPAPLGDCGPDTTEDELGCASFPRCAPSDPDAYPTSKGDLLVKPVDHASVVLLWDGKAIYADPVGGAARYKGLPPPDLIVVTHTHGDHFDGPTIRGIAVTGTVLAVPAAVASSLAGSGGAGKAEVRTLANGQKTSAAGIEVEAVAMYNTTASRLQYHQKGQGNGYVLDLAGTRVYVSGDTEATPEMRALPGIDVAFICMNLPFTMTPTEAAAGAVEFKPRVVYPYHYRGQDPKQFQSILAAQAPEIEVRLRNWYP